jgi:S1-C subfamily serine protease
MNIRQVQLSKKSVAKVMGVHRSFNFREPYQDSEDVEFGGTAFFINPSIFGSKFPLRTGKRRFALTNFHVVDELVQRKCFLCYPEKGKSQITAEIVFIVPSLDVAILMVDPDGEHSLWFDDEDIGTFIKSIPNLDIDDRPIKGNSQNVVAIGFPNLSTDYQLCEGCISGRGHSMIQLSISLNGGNSGGPLLMNGKVIGICTASISESEALGLAVPIHQTLRFFQQWTSFDNIILRTPSWPFKTKTTTPDYLKYHNIHSSVQGCTVQKYIGIDALDKDDIIMAIYSGKKRYAVDNFGLVSVPWTDKRVSICNQEFILSLDIRDIRLHVFKWATKKTIRDTSTKPIVMPLKVRETHHCWEPVPYCILGGIVFMDLTTNHYDFEEDDEEEPNQVSSLIHFGYSTMHLESTVIITFIPPQTTLSSQHVLREFDRIIKCNDTPVKNVRHLEKLIRQAVKSYNHKDRNTTNNAQFIVLETNNTKVYLNMETLRAKEMEDVKEERYSRKKCHLINLNINKRKINKRKRSY